MYIFIAQKSCVCILPWIKLSIGVAILVGAGGSYMYVLDRFKLSIGVSFLVCGVQVNARAYTHACTYRTEIIYVHSAVD